VLKSADAFTSQVDVVSGLFLMTRTSNRPIASKPGLSAWLAGPISVQKVVERLAREIPKLESAGCHVQLGVATGCNSIFVGTADTLPVERDLLIPTLDTSDLKNGNFQWRGRFVIDTHRPDGLPWRRDERPRLYRYLLKEHGRLIDRASVRQGRSWRLMLSRADHDLKAASKLLIPETGLRAKIALDLGGHLPLNSIHAVTSSEWPLVALHSLLATAGVGLQMLALSVKRSGGYMRLNATGLRQVRLPSWQTLQDRDAAALMSDDRSKIAEATARIYGLSDQLLRLCNAMGWEAH
jgi:hypothetical protein